MPPKNQESAPKRKYVKKVKEICEFDKSVHELSNELKELSIDLVSQVSQVSKEIESEKPVQIQKSIEQFIHISNYEFMKPVDIYLHYMVEPLGKNTDKYLYFTHVNGLCGYILLPLNIPNKEPSKYTKSESSIVELVPNKVRLHIMKYTVPKREYTYEMCEKNVTKKRNGDEMDEERSIWDWDYCQIKIKGLSHLCVNKYAIFYENRYIYFSDSNL